MPPEPLTPSFALPCFAPPPWYVGSARGSRCPGGNPGCHPRVLCGLRLCCLQSYLLWWSHAVLIELLVRYQSIPVPRFRQRHRCLPLHTACAPPRLRQCARNPPVAYANILCPPPVHRHILPPLHLVYIWFVSGINWYLVSTGNIVSNLKD